MGLMYKGALHCICEKIKIALPYIYIKPTFSFSPISSSSISVAVPYSTPSIFPSFISSWVGDPCRKCKGHYYRRLCCTVVPVEEVSLMYFFSCWLYVISNFQFWKYIMQWIVQDIFMNLKNYFVCDYYWQRYD